MNLNQELIKIESVIRREKLNIDVFKEHVAHEPDNITRLYVTSKSLGGLLISNGGDGWIPCFPEKPNYPFKGKWFSHSRNYDENWVLSILKKLNPDAYPDSFTDMGMMVGTERNAKNIDPFRRHTAIAIFKNLLNQEA